MSAYIAPMCTLAKERPEQFPTGHAECNGNVAYWLAAYMAAPLYHDRCDCTCHAGQPVKKKVIQQ